MIETEFRATVHCDHMRWDTAAIRAGQFMANAAAGSLGCLVTAGPYPSGDAARQSAKAAGWWLTYPWPGRSDHLLYCPLHRDEARQFWGESSS